MEYNPCDWLQLIFFARKTQGKIIARDGEWKTCKIDADSMIGNCVIIDTLSSFISQFQPVHIDTNSLLREIYGISLSFP